MNGSHNFVELLNETDALKDISAAVVSPLLNLIAIVTKQNDAKVYLLPHTAGSSIFWQSSSKAKRCIFSENGKQLLLLLSVNSIQVYNIEDDSIILSFKINASSLATILLDYTIDYSCVSEVRPLTLKRNQLLLEIDGKLVCLQWESLGAEMSVRYTTILPTYRTFKLSQSKLFILLLNNVLVVYDLLRGQKLSEELNPCLANRANADISIGRHFHKFAVNNAGRLLAVVNQDEGTILFDISEAFDRMEGRATTPSDSKKDKWSWPGMRKSSSESRVFPGKILRQIEPITGLVVSHLQFTIHGLCVFYSILGHPHCSSVKLVDVNNGQIVHIAEGITDCKPVFGGSMPMLMSSSKLFMWIGGLSSDSIIAKLCEIIPECVLKQSDSLEPCNVEIDTYLEFTRIILGLHTNFHRFNLRLICREGTEESEYDSIESKLLDRLMCLSSLPITDERLLSSCFLHLVHVLDLTLSAVKGANPRSVVSLDAIASTVLGHVNSCYQRVKHLNLLRHEWVSWVDSAEQEVIEEALVLGNVALALVFFTTERQWEVGTAIEKFKTEAKVFIFELISVGNLEKATTALVTLGCEPIQYYRSVCMDTCEPLMRDLLVGHLRKEDKLSADEEEAWKFSKLVESALANANCSFRNFEHKMCVSASDQAKIVMLKMEPFKGSLEISTILTRTSEWRSAVITELYFCTGDITLEDRLEKDVCWAYLINVNCVDLLLNWVDISFDPNFERQNADYILKMFLNLYSRWPVTAEMLETLFHYDCMAATKFTILDRCAKYGMFCISEQSDMPAVVRRLQNSCLLPRATEILSQPSANVTPADLYKWILKECSQHGYKLPVLKCLREANMSDSLPFGPEFFNWLSVWKSFETWDGKDKNVMLQLLESSSEIVPVSPEDAPLLKVASCLLKGEEVLDVIKDEGNDSSLRTIPLIDICWQSLERARSPDISLYDLMARSHLPVGKLFAWQSENSYVTEPQVPETFPHFNNQVLCAKFGYKQHLDYLYYLRQSRPSFACNLFIVESLRTHRRLTTKMINRACGLAHGMALRLWNEESVGSAAVAFIAMLGDIPTANALRLHLAAVSAVAESLPEEQRKYVGDLTYAIVKKDVDILQDFAVLLESTVMNQVSQLLDPVEKIRKWTLPVTFCNMHGFPLPTGLPRSLAKDKDWFHFILCLDLYKYPYDQAIELIEEMDDPILKAHLLRALTRTTLKLATTSPSKSPPRIRLEPDSAPEDDEMKDVFQVFVTNVYTEVLTTIQTFTDRNIVLPWSCEQNPDDDVLLTLLKCESEPDTARSLLVACLELQSPVLAVLSTCYQADNVAAPLIAWLLSSIPTSLSRSKLKEEIQLLPLDRNVSAEQVQALLLDFFATGYFQTFYRGMTIFLPDNPLTLLVEAIYQSVVEGDTEAALRCLKSFVLEITHGGSTRGKDIALYSQEWVLGTASLLIESVLTRCDIIYSVKIMFLKLLADSELANVHSVFPKFLLWYQICEILEPTHVRLEFAPMYHLSLMSAEIERCLDELLRIRAFSAALEFSALLSLNKDRIIITTWEEQFQEATARGDVSQFWSESSSAFKDENVNPSLVASFYYKLSSCFPDKNSDCLTNKFLALRYCLFWRKLVEDTLMSSYREESDVIELEQWQCCLEADFEQGTLQSENSVNMAFSLLVNQWPPPKLMVRASALSAGEMVKVKDLINFLLDVGDLISASRVSAFFNCENQDLMTISSCLQVALGEIEVSELSKYSSLLGSPRKLLTTVMNQEPKSVDGFEVIQGRENSPALALLELLCSSVLHGCALANRIFICYRLSCILDITFKEIASETNYIDLLSRSVTQDCESKMSVASDILTLANLSDVVLAKYLAEQLVAAVSASLAPGLDVSAQLWGVNLDLGFYHVIALMKSPSILGTELLNASTTLPYPEGVEMVIRAHDCYSNACDVEGIGRVLRRARIISMQILQTQQWRYLVRLLVGVGRYSDMAYIFQMLKDNDQFEHLLRKNSSKAPGFSMAVSDFLQRTCPEDRELAKMVAAFFNHHGNQAVLWQTEAEEHLAQLTQPLKDSSKTKQTLTSALEKYTNAATWYLQAGKMNKALRITREAQMVALQISLLGGPFILNVDNNQLQGLAQETLSVYYIQAIASARDIQVDWVPIIHERWVLHGDKTFLSDMKSSSVLSSSVLSRYFLKYDKEALTGKVKERAKHLSSLHAPQTQLMKEAMRAMR